MAEITIISPEYVIFDQMKINEKVFTIEEYMPDSDISDISLQVNKRWTIAGKVENVAPEQTSNYTVFIKSRDKNDEVYATINPDGSFSGSFIGDFNCQAGLYTKSMNLASEIVEFSLELGKPEPFIILTPAQPQVIKGHVLDHTGARLAGCEILAKGAISNLFTKSDTNGEFRLETLEKILQITASSLQYTQKIEKVVDIPFNEELVFQFWMGKILGGIVTTSDEKPVATASSKYEWVDNQSGVHKTNQTYSDIKGRFRITDINNDLAERIYCQPQSAVGTDSAALGEVQIDDVPLPDENFKIVGRFHFLNIIFQIIKIVQKIVHQVAPAEFGLAQHFFPALFEKNVRVFHIAQHQRFGNRRRALRQIAHGAEEIIKIIILLQSGAKIQADFGKTVALGQLIHEQPIALVGGNPPRGSVRLSQKSVIGELLHFNAD